MVEAKVIIDSEQSECVIHTEAYFGCKYFIPIHGNVVTKIDPT
jgi:hypothetical protein